jgi:hypothetical protein
MKRTARLLTFSLLATLLSGLPACLSAREAPPDPAIATPGGEATSGANQPTADAPSADESAVAPAEPV